MANSLGWIANAIAGEGSDPGVRGFEISRAKVPLLV